MRKHLPFFLILMVTTSYAVVSRAATQADAPFWTGQRDAASFTKLQEDRLASAKQSLDRMIAVTGKRTIENTLKPYDEMLTYLDAVANQASLIKEVHPDESVRTAAEKISQKAEAFNTEVSLNRAVYDAIAALDLTGADPETRYYVERDKVLAPGGSQPAHKLVESFLSRPFNFNAWQAWLDQGN